MPMGEFDKEDKGKWTDDELAMQVIELKNQLASYKDELASVTSRNIALIKQIGNTASYVETKNAPTLERVHILQEAIKIISKDRTATHGQPEKNFDDIARMWSVILEDCIDPEDLNIFQVKGHHVAMCMIAVKLCRMKQSPGCQDHWVDSAGYSGCGWESVLDEESTE